MEFFYLINRFKRNSVNLKSLGLIKNQNLFGEPF